MNQKKKRKSRWDTGPQTQEINNTINSNNNNDTNNDNNGNISGFDGNINGNIGIGGGGDRSKNGTFNSSSFGRHNGGQRNQGMIGFDNMDSSFNNSNGYNKGIGYGNDDYGEGGEKQAEEDSDDDEEDPLDSFMAGVHEDLRNTHGETVLSMVKGDSSNSDLLMKKLSADNNDMKPDAKRRKIADDSNANHYNDFSGKNDDDDAESSAGSSVVSDDVDDNNNNNSNNNSNKKRDYFSVLQETIRRGKKDLRSVDHSKIDYLPIEKNLYVESTELASEPPEETLLHLQTLGNIKVRGLKRRKGHQQRDNNNITTTSSNSRKSNRKNDGGDDGNNNNNNNNNNNDNLDAVKARDERSIDPIEPIDPPRLRPIRSFTQAGLPPRVVSHLHGPSLRFTDPTPIQSCAIPVLLSGRDLIGIARTGSGKTLAFGLPLLRHVAAQPRLRKHENGPLAVVMAPTRELAVQIHGDLSKISRHFGHLRIVAAYGGASIAAQIAEVKRGAEIVVCTPGRMIDLLCANSGKVVNLKRVTYVVLDEADRMFDLGFEPQVMRVMSNVRPDRQVAMFSATFPKALERVARKALTSPVEIIIGGRSVVSDDVTQIVEVVRSEDERFSQLLRYLGRWDGESSSVLVFVETQARVDSLYSTLIKRGYTCLTLHGGVDQNDRDSTLADFKAGVAKLLIATSVAARGLDVKDLKLVINFNVPGHYEDYVHRCGRTGRAGRKGTAVTFVAPNEYERAPDVVAALRASKRDVPEDLLKLAQRAADERKKRREEREKAAAKDSNGGIINGGGSKDSKDGKDSKDSKDGKDSNSSRKDGTAAAMDVVDSKDTNKDTNNDNNVHSQNDNSDNNSDHPVNDKKQHPRPRRRHVVGGFGGSGYKFDSAEAAASRLLIEREKAALGVAGAGEPNAAAAGYDSDALDSDVDDSDDSDVVITIVEQGTTTTIGGTTDSQTASAAMPQAPAEAPVERVVDTSKMTPAELIAYRIEQEIQAKKRASQQGHPGMGSIGSSSADGAIAMRPSSMLGSSTATASSLSSAASATSAMSSSSSSSSSQPSSSLPSSSLSSLSGKKHFQTEFEINDYPQAARWQVVKKDALEDIIEWTRTAISIRGNHYAPGRAVKEGDRKLHVCIEGDNEDMVRQARKEVKRKIEAAAIRAVDKAGTSNRYSVI